MSIDPIHVRKLFKRATETQGLPTGGKVSSSVEMTLPNPIANQKRPL